MKRIFAISAALILAASLILLAGCRRNDNGQDAAAPTNVPVITQSPDGMVTAGPTATPEATPVPTDVPVITQSPGGEVTAGPTATPAATPAPTDVPVITQSPGGEVTAGPTATPVATPAPTAVPTNVPVITQSPGGEVTAGPTATPIATPTPAAPTSAPTSAPTPTPEPPVPTPDAPNGFSAAYAGAIVDCSSLKVGDRFYWTIDLKNESSSLAAGLWLIDHDERFVKPVGFSYTWEGSLYTQIMDSWDNEEAASDVPDFFINILYAGATGANPYGEAGNYYSIVGMYLTTGSFGGVQASGPMVRFNYEVIAAPSVSDMQHDADGYYIPVGIVVIESTALDGNEPVTHGSISVEAGRMYFRH